MTLIEGVGDEVLNFFMIVGTLFVGWVAWCSTNIGDQPLIRTVLILQERTRTRIAALRANPVQVLAMSQQHPTDNSDNESRQSNSSSSSEVDASCPDSPLPATSTVIAEPAATPAATNEEVLIRAMDSFNNEEADTKVNQVEKTSTEASNNIGETKTTETSNDAAVASSESEQTEANVTNDNEKNISIKLKFINDDQKLVTGNLNEMLGDFKRKHFQLELESRKLVRLVFNGHVLQPDEITLEQCGFFNNCVVHCLIHQPRPAPTATTTLDSSSHMYFNPPPYQNIPAGAGLGSAQAEWDLSRLLVSIVTLVLGLAWFFRYHYAQLFTITTTVGLFGLTAIFTFSLFGHLLPDQDSIRNIE
ncbi:transmembrane and ubiquitin-like domain-containing protein 1 [Copidosoma floridanum]|uniref:transmembrane and ubiquitin-like domain-containing protein 1 n=1 Tax=Copidosoma floridanum TaxID=29053 RepID=UPI0006C99C48|nr:transmembrane and ubiquitin-like domain-containing protein 1 [Copidosoma floridanum]